MAIAYKSVGTATATGTNTAIFTYPNGIAAGDMIVLGVVNKYPTNAPSTLTGYTFPANGQGMGGAGTAGTDGGTVYTTAFYKVATGSETGAATVTVTSGNSAGANVVVYSPTSAAYDWSTPVAGNGADSTRGTAWSITAGSAMDIMANDMVVVISGANADAQTYSAESIAMGGITSWGAHTERADIAITGGNDTRLVISDHTASAGTATTAGTFTMTANGTLSAGASVIVRLREYWARGTVAPGDGFQTQVGDTAAVYTTYFITGADGLQAQTGDTASVYTTYFASGADGFQAQTGDTATGTFTVAAINVTGADGFQAQTGDVAGVSAGYPVTASDGLQEQTGDAATVRAGYNVTIPEGSMQQDQHGHSATVRAGYPLTPGQGDQTQTGDTASLSALTSNSSVTPGDGFQAQTSDTASVFSGYPIAPPDGFQTQTGDIGSGYSGYYIDFSQGYQAQFGDPATVESLVEKVYLPPDQMSGHLSPGGNRGAVGGVGPPSYFANTAGREVFEESRDGFTKYTSDNFPAGFRKKGKR
jgi:hypothetical protein